MMMDDQQGEAAPILPAGRQPSQRRSRERVEKLLSTATALIAASGSDALRMSDVAQQAGVSIGSLYQYFPDKAALIRALAERYNEAGRHCTATELDAVQQPDELPGAMLRILDGYFAMFQAEPAMRDIWSGTQSDKALQAMDAEDGRWHAARLAATLRRLHPALAAPVADQAGPVADQAALERRCFLLMYLLCATVRVGIAVGEVEGAAMVAAFKPMLLRELALLAASA